MLKWLAGPFRTYFNARFGAVHESVVQGQADDNRHFSHTFERLDATSARIGELERLLHESETRVRELHETTMTQRDEALQISGLLGRAVGEVSTALTEFISMQTAGAPGENTLARVVQRLDELTLVAAKGTFDVEKQGPLDVLDAYDSAVANYTNAHDGWASQAGLWFNPPISIEHAPGGASLADVNERIAEIPFVLGAMASVPRGSRVVDVGCTESTVALSLATLGHQVTAVDPRPYPLRHQNLTTFVGPVDELTSDEPYDAAILLSSVEHFGLGSYDLPVDDESDLKAMKHLHDLVRPGGRLVLTTPYGDAPTTALQRTYGPDRLAALLEGWDVEEMSFLTKVSRTEWIWEPAVSDLSGDHVVLVSATRSATG